MAILRATNVDSIHAVCLLTYPRLDSGVHSVVCLYTTKRDRTDRARKLSLAEIIGYRSFEP